jgi:hypothetical protein
LVRLEGFANEALLLAVAFDDGLVGVGREVGGWVLGKVGGGDGGVAVGGDDGEAEGCTEGGEA